MVAHWRRRLINPRPNDTAPAAVGRGVSGRLRPRRTASVFGWGVIAIRGEPGDVYDTIVHPTDGSDGAEAALRHAVSLAETYDAELHVLYVVPELDVPASGRLTQVVERLTDAGETIVDEAEETARNEGLHQVSTHLRRGHVDSRILEFVAERDGDLLVVGTHGRSGVDRVLLGSTTEKVLHQSGVPVLAVDGE